jgi:hypothetical protein
MKIIRHSHKTIVYSLSLLLYAQQTSCMAQDPDRADHPDQKSINQLTVMHQGHDNVDQVIDTIQQAIGGVHEDDTNIQYFMLDLPERGNQSHKGKACSARQLEAVICEIQTQRQTYDAAFWFNWIQYWDKKYNKRVIRNNFQVTVSDAYTRRCQGFNPTIIENLPKSANDIKPLVFIQYLQRHFGAIPKDIRETLRCLYLQKGYSVMHAPDDQPKHYTQTIENTLSNLARMHDFFDNPPCCLSFWGRSAIEDEYRIFLRTHIISHNSLIARLKCLKALTLPKQMPPSQEQQQQKPQPMHPNPYFIIVGGGNPPSYADPSHVLSQVADPFIPGSGVGSINNDDLTK